MRSNLLMAPLIWFAKMGFNKKIEGVEFSVPEVYLELPMPKLEIPSAFHQVLYIFATEAVFFGGGNRV